MNSLNFLTDDKVTVCMCTFVYWNRNAARYRPCKHHGRLRIKKAGFAVFTFFFIFLSFADYQIVNNWTVQFVALYHFNRWWLHLNTDGYILINLILCGNVFEILRKPNGHNAVNNILTTNGNNRVLYTLYTNQVLISGSDLTYITHNFCPYEADTSYQVH